MEIKISLYNIIFLAMKRTVFVFHLKNHRCMQQPPKYSFSWCISNIWIMNISWWIIWIFTFIEMKIIVWNVAIRWHCRRTEQLNLFFWRLKLNNNFSFTKLICWYCVFKKQFLCIYLKCVGFGGFRYLLVGTLELARQANWSISIQIRPIIKLNSLKNGAP